MTMHATIQAEPMLSPAYARGVCEAMVALGHDHDAFLARAGLDASLYANAAWLPLARVDALLQEAVATTGDPAFGLHWAERSPMMQFDVGPSLVASAPTLGKALDAIVQLQFVFANRAQLSLQRAGSRSTLTFDLLAASTLGRHVVTELALVSLLRGFRYLGQAQALRRIDVDYAPPAHAAEYTRIFGALLHFDQPRTSIEFASPALERREGAYDEPLHQMLREHTEQRGLRARGELTLREQLADHVRAALPRVLPIDEAAARLDLSARSLRRRLHAEQLSYSAIVDDVQRERALQLLAKPSLALKLIASEAGFQSMSGFRRAFRRWTGESPGRGR